MKDPIDLACRDLDAMAEDFADLQQRVKQLELDNAVIRGGNECKRKEIEQLREENERLTIDRDSYKEWYAKSQDYASGCEKELRAATEREKKLMDKYLERECSYCPMPSEERGPRVCDECKWRGGNALAALTPTGEVK